MNFVKVLDIFLIRHIKKLFVLRKNIYMYAVALQNLTFIHD